MAADFLPREKVWKYWLSLLAQQKGAGGPRGVAAHGRGLDLDHLRAQLGHQQGGVGPCPVVFDGQNPDALQRAPHQ